jgi:hypothetical protein
MLCKLGVKYRQVMHTKSNDLFVRTLMLVGQGPRGGEIGTRGIYAANVKQRPASVIFCQNTGALLVVNKFCNTDELLFRPSEPVPQTVQDVLVGVMIEGDILRSIDHCQCAYLIADLRSGSDKRDLQ